MSKTRTTYTSEQIDFVKDLVQKGMEVTPATKKMCEHFCLNYTESVGRGFRKKMQDLGITTNIKLIEDTDAFKTAQQREFKKDTKKFIITWAQNATPAHKGFLANIEAYAKEIEAEIHIIAGRYKNPTSKFPELKDEYWVKDVIPYLDANRHNIHPFLAILSDIKVHPTASTPLSGFNGVTGLESCIIGHPRVHMKSLPVLDGYLNKLLLTTGAVTVENYTDSKAGKKGEFHHQLGFVLVELDGDIFHVRQVTADKFGNFYDLMYYVEKGNVYDNLEGGEIVVLGDLHVGEEDEKAVEASFKLLEMMRPEHVILHDVFNGHSISHHEKKDPFQLLKREVDGTDSLKDEIKQLKKWFSKHPDYDYVVVRSNHDDFLDRWLMGEDWRKAANKFEYLKYANILAKGKAPKGIIPYILDKHFSPFVQTLGIDDSYRVHDWELGVHGHLGANGSKGSAIQFKNLNTKTVTGHTHTPHREDGHLSVGTLTELRVGYNQGMSSWMHSNVIIYPDGKASHIHIIKGRFTTMF